MKIELEISDEAFEQFGARLLEMMAKHVPAVSDPLLTCAQAGKRLGMSHSTVRQLVNIGKLKRAPGLIDIRIRQSVVDAYGKDTGK